MRRNLRPAQFDVQIDALDRHKMLIYGEHGSHWHELFMAADQLGESAGIELELEARRHGRRRVLDLCAELDYAELILTRMRLPRC